MKFKLGKTVHVKVKDTLVFCYVAFINHGDA
jgi:hypothetical protein